MRKQLRHQVKSKHFDFCQRTVTHHLLPIVSYNVASSVFCCVRCLLNALPVAVAKRKDGMPEPLSLCSLQPRVSGRLGEDT